MLIKTPEGIKVLQDWHPERIGLAYVPEPPPATSGDEFVQNVFLPPIGGIPRPTLTQRWRHLLRS